MKHPTLIEPKRRDNVDLFINVKARNPLNACLWAVIHSHSDGGYWAVKLDSNNEAVVRVGDPGDVSKHHHFKLRIMEPAEDIKCDVRMDKWPKFHNSSAIFSLRRK